MGSGIDEALLDVVQGRAGSVVADWLAGLDEAWRAAVERVAQDPYRGYHNLLVGGLDAPEVVVDAFHIVRLGNQMLDEVRRRVQQQTLGHRGRKGDPLYGIRRLLLTGEERLTDRGRQRIADGLAAGDRDDEVVVRPLRQGAPPPRLPRRRRAARRPPGTR